MIRTATLRSEELEHSSSNTNDLQKLKGLLEKLSSLSGEETDVLKAMVELSRGLKQ